MKHTLGLTLVFLSGYSFLIAEPLPVAEVKRSAQVDFSTEILPILQRNCLACHNETKAKADLILETPESIAKGGDSGPSVVPGKPDKSPLFLTACHLDDPVMPPPNNTSKARNLTAKELGLLKRWIKEGAKGTVLLYAPAPEKWIRDKNNSSIYALATSSDSRWAALGRGHFIDIYDLKKGQRVARLQDPALEFGAHLDLVYSLAFCPDGTLASGGFREIKLWRRGKISPTTGSGEWVDANNPDLQVENNKATLSMDGKSNVVTHLGTIAHAALSPDRSYLITAAASNTASLWLSKDAKKVVDLDLAPEIPLILVQLKIEEAILDRLISTYKTAVDERKRALGTEKTLSSEIEKTITSLQTDLQKATEAESQKELNIKLDSEKRKSKANQKIIAEDTTRLASAEKNLAEATQKKNASMAESKKLSDSRAEIITKATIAGAGFSPDNSEVFVALKSGVIHRYDTSSGAWLETTSMGRSIERFQVSKDFIITQSEPGKLQQRPLTSDFQLVTTIGDGKNGNILSDRVTTLACSPDGKYLVSGSGISTRVGMLKIWNPTDGKLIKEARKAHADTITSIRFNRAGDALVSGGTDKFAKVFSVPDLRRLHSLEGHTDHVLGVDWSFDGQTIVTAGGDYNLKYWKAESGELARTVKRGDFQVCAVRFLSPSGDAVACAFGDDTLKQDTTDFPDVGGPVKVIELTKDGKHLIAGGEDGRLRIWTTSDRKLVRVFEP